MFCFIISMFGLVYTVGKYCSEKSSNKTLNRQHEKAKKRLNEFLYGITADDDTINRVENNTDYSDVIDDFNYIFNQNYTAEEIDKLVKNYKAKAFGNQKRYKEIVMEIRLAKMGKCRGFLQTEGVRFIDGSSFYDSLLRYYKLLRSYFDDNGIYMELTEIKINKYFFEMNFNEMKLDY